MPRLPILVLFLFAATCLVGCDNDDAPTNSGLICKNCREMVIEYMTYTAIIDEVDDSFRRLRDLGYSEDDLAGAQFSAVTSIREHMLMSRGLIADKIVEMSANNAYMKTTRDGLGALERLVNRLDDGMARKTPDSPQ